MCGIAGFFDFGNKRTEGCLRAAVTPMVDALLHRGPDAGAVWVNPEGVALGHRRLSILDLSPAGHQPMHSACGRFVIVFNGEIYNHMKIREELEQMSNSLEWRGHSDTEVILAAVGCWGLEAAIKRFVGMFAFALWDRDKQVLHLVRDRLGEKPLYYGWVGNIFLFGSELKALRAHSAWKGEIDRGVLALFLRHNYIPAPYSIYKNIFKLLPGTILNISASISGHNTAPVPYWSAKMVAETGYADSYKGDAQEAVATLEQLLKDAVAHQMVADVPLGAFLSGGIDSTTVVALMQAQSDHPVRTFTIGFEEAEYNEAEHAKTLARYLGTEHTELYVKAEDALAVIPHLSQVYDEPFADASQIPTLLVAKLARQHVKVSLSGDGGDELFGGYNRYSWGQNIWGKTGRLPAGLKTLFARGLTSVTPHAWEVFFRGADLVLPKKFRHRNRGDKLHKLAEILTAENQEAMYLWLVSHWKRPCSMIPNSTEPPTVLTDRNQWAKVPDFTLRMMYLDAASYLPDDILVKVDRAAMAMSLETRVPMLDHRVVEFAWRLPLALKIREKQGKWPLRQILHKYVPKELIERPKMGFGVPIDVWLRGPLRDWAESLLDENRLKEQGFFDPRPIRKKWLEHLSGQRNWQYCLWNILMFQAWLEP